jgi:3-dehydro-L-gulonate 2-dehydrogenase
MNFIILVTSMKNSQPASVSITPEEMRLVFYRILLQMQLPEDKAQKCADVFTENSVDGVLSHGVNRFARFVKLIDKGIIDPRAEPSCTKSIGALEQWNGNGGLGITNAFFSTARAMSLADKNGIGCVAMSYTNHWMRAGAYARHAALKGFAFIAWSNTIKNTPAWGAVDPRLGNSPLTIGIPNENTPVVLDMALSQFSYGALEKYKLDGKELPVYGGFDASGKLSTNPGAVIESRRTLPIGYWKGSGLSLLLDILAAILSGGLSVSEISKQNEEKNLSQVFIAFDLKSLHNFPSLASTLRHVISDLKESTPIEPGTSIRYPGETVHAVRAKSDTHGIEVNVKKWNEILELLKK